jgi:hypothetical protein
LPETVAMMPVPAAGAQNGLVSRPRLDLESDVRVHPLEPAIADNQPIVGVLERKVLRDGLNRFAELSLGAPRLGLGALALLFQPMAVDEAVALHRQRRRHPQGATRAFQTGIGR